MHKFFWFSDKQLSALRTALICAPPNRHITKLLRLVKREQKARR